LNEIKLRILVQDEDSKINVLNMLNPDEKEAQAAFDRVLKALDLCREGTQADIDTHIRRPDGAAMLEHMKQRRDSRIPRPALLSDDPKNPDQGLPALAQGVRGSSRPSTESHFRDFRDTDGKIVHSIGSFLTVWTSVASSTDAVRAKGGAAGTPTAGGRGGRSRLQWIGQRGIGSGGSGSGSAAADPAARTNRRRRVGSDSGSTGSSSTAAGAQGGAGGAAGNRPGGAGGAGGAAGGTLGRRLRGQREHRSGRRAEVALRRPRPASALLRPRHRVQKLEEEKPKDQPAEEAAAEPLLDEYGDEIIGPEGVRLPLEALRGRGLRGSALGGPGPPEPAPHDSEQRLLDLIIARRSTSAEGDQLGRPGSREEVRAREEAGDTLLRVVRSSSGATRSTPSTS
jgi:hypothetical protein